MREFELEYRVRYEFVDAKGACGASRAKSPSPRLLVRRIAGAGERAEERQLVRDMQLDAAARRFCGACSR